jgi:hypothetical protein
VNHRSTSVSASRSQVSKSTPSAAAPAIDSAPPENSSASSGRPASIRSHAGATSERACTGVRSAAGTSKSRSSTACTSVPRVAAGLGFSGSRSITRKR